jgi:hypothetical protein
MRRKLEQMLKEERERLADETAAQKKRELEKQLEARKTQPPAPMPPGVTPPTGVALPTARMPPGPMGVVPLPVPTATAAPAVASSGPPLVLMLKPFDQTTRVGQRFVSEVAVHSEKPQSFDRLDVRISYPSYAVRPMRIFDYPLKGALDPEDPPTSKTDGGTVTYRATFREPMQSLGNMPLFYVAWEGIAELEGGRLSLGGQGDPGSAVYLGEENLLEANMIVGKAYVDQTLIVAGDAKRPGLRIRRARLQSPWEGGPAPPATVRLVLESPEAPPQIGEEFVLNVFLQNPDRVHMDKVKLAVGFDPSQVEVLDWDYKGRIKQGVNVFDAHAHLRYPFDIHLRNEADNRLGRISYQMGLSRMSPLPSGGLVRVRCRALGPNATETFTLFPPNQTREWDTDVLAGDRSVLQRSTPDLAAPQPPAEADASSAG